MIKNVIWDFDGTLFNSYPYLAGALKDALAMHGIEEDLNAIIEKSMDCERAALEFFSAKYGMGEGASDADYFQVQDRRRPDDNTAVPGC